MTSNWVCRIHWQHISGLSSELSSFKQWAQWDWTVWIQSNKTRETKSKNVGLESQTSRAELKTGVLNENLHSERWQFQLPFTPKPRCGDWCLVYLALHGGDWILSRILEETKAIERSKWKLQKPVIAIPKSNRWCVIHKAIWGYPVNEEDILKIKNILAKWQHQEIIK
jgi:hypothetical protein